MTSPIVSIFFIHIYLKLRQSYHLQTIKNVMEYVSVEYLTMIRKVLIFKIRVPLFGFGLCKTNETFLNGHGKALVYLWKQTLV